MLEAERARLALHSDTVDLANRASMLAASGIEKYEQLLIQQETQYNRALERNARQLNGEYTPPIFPLHQQYDAPHPAISALSVQACAVLSLGCAGSPFSL